MVTTLEIKEMQTKRVHRINALTTPWGVQHLPLRVAQCLKVHRGKRLLCASCPFSPSYLSYPSCLSFLSYLSFPFCQKPSACLVGLLSPLDPRDPGFMPRLRVQCPSQTLCINGSCARALALLLYKVTFPSRLAVTSLLSTADR